MTEFERGFKEGVEKATAPLFLDHDDYQPPTQINLKLEKRRKNLLTRKVTKWFAVYDNGGSGEFLVIKHSPFVEDSKSMLFDSKAEAEKKISGYPKRVGGYPIEIEETL